MNTEQIIDFNLDQRHHEVLVGQGLLDLARELMAEALGHDASKWSRTEYEGFVQAREDLSASTTGRDAGYQKQLLSGVIQAHIHGNAHHPEYWDNLRQEMPLVQAMVMYFDWRSRSLAKGQDMSGFWDYNLAKLERQPRARAVVELLRARDEESRR